MNERRSHKSALDTGKMAGKMAGKKRKKRPIMKEDTTKPKGSYALVILLILLIIAALAALTVVLYKNSLPSKNIGSPAAYKTYVLESANEFSFPPDLILAVIQAESNFDPNAVSGVGARGLMQIMPQTALLDINRMLKSDYSAEDLFDPAINIRCGTCYLAYLYDIFHDYDTMLAAYNAGMGNVWKWLKEEQYAQDGKLTTIPNPETAAYVLKVNSFLDDYRGIYD